MNDRSQPEVRTTAILEDLRTSPTNPRRRMDKVALAELTASVREVGILQPLIVRKLGKDFELDLFGDVAAEKKGRDVCTNPTCFQAKVKAWADLQVELAAANGQKVLSAKDVKKVWPRGGGHTDYSSPYVALDDECYQDSKDRPYKTLLGSDAPEAILAIDPDGRPRQLVPRAEAEAILAKKHALAGHRGRGASSGPSPAEKKRRAEGEHVARVNGKLMERVAEVAEGQALRTPSVEVWAAIAGLAIRSAQPNTRKDVCRRRGWLEEKPAKGKGRPPRLKSHQDILLGKLGELSGAQARGLAIEVLYAPYVGLARPNSWYSRTSTSGPALAALGIDLKDVQEIVRREEAQEAKAKSAPKQCLTTIAATAFSPDLEDITTRARVEAAKKGMLKKPAKAKSVPKRTVKAVDGGGKP